MAIGIYISVPFCRSKCSYCNFASDVFSRSRMQAYVDRVCADIAAADAFAETNGGRLQREVDSIYLGGGTPSILDVAQLRQLFDCVRREFDVKERAEITVECAPGTLSKEMLEALIACGVNRVSLGVQSFVDAESRAVGRLHTAETTLRDIEALRHAAINDINVDLIAGLPRQTEESWSDSLAQAIATKVPHVSVYMLEVDDESRLGRELLAGGTRYHAHFVPNDELIAELYGTACRILEDAGIQQYEISNFSRPSSESRHNSKYWTRQPYLGFGVDAHSMLPSTDPAFNAIRVAMPDSLDSFTQQRGAGAVTPVTEQNAWEEIFFLGLRLNRGVNLAEAERAFGEERAAQARQIADELLELGLAEVTGGSLCLTGSGRLVSNTIFAMFLAPQDETVAAAHTSQ